MENVVESEGVDFNSLADVQREWRKAKNTDAIMLAVFDKFKAQPADSFINCVWCDPDMIKGSFINQRIMAPDIGYDGSHNIKWVNMRLCVSDGVVTYWFMASTNSGFTGCDENSIGVQEGKNLTVLTRFETNVTGREAK